MNSWNVKDIHAALKLITHHGMLGFAGILSGFIRNIPVLLQPPEVNRSDVEFGEVR